jgi:hypothetical protein
MGFEQGSHEAGHWRGGHELSHLDLAARVEVGSGADAEQVDTVDESVDRRWIMALLPAGLWPCQGAHADCHSS